MEDQSMNEVWDFAGMLSDQIHRRVRMHEIRVEIAKVRCGDCDKWMKSSLCPAERHDMKRGRSVGPSCEGLICSQFVESESSARIRASRRAELQRIEGSPASGETK
jgi:hypothetical protein